MGRKRISPPGAKEPLLMTVDEVKETLKIGTTSVYALINEGKLERRKVGRLSRITFASVKRVAGV